MTRTLRSCLIAALAMAGCPGPSPARAPADRSGGPADIIGQLQARPPAPGLSNEDLNRRIVQDKSIGLLARGDLLACEKEQRDRALARWRRICFWSGLGLALLAVAASVLITRFTGNFGLAWKVGGAVLACAGLCFLADVVLAHPWWTVGLVAGLTAAGIALKVHGRWREVHEALRLVAVGADDAAVAASEVLSSAGLRRLLARVKGEA